MGGHFFQTLTLIDVNEFGTKRYRTRDDLIKVCASFGYRLLMINTLSSNLFWYLARNEEQAPDS